MIASPNLLRALDLEARFRLYNSRQRCQITRDYFAWNMAPRNSDRPWDRPEYISAIEQMKARGEGIHNDYGLRRPR